MDAREMKKRCADVVAAVAKQYQVGSVERGAVLRALEAINWADLHEQNHLSTKARQKPERTLWDMVRDHVARGPGQSCERTYVHPWERR